jgi:hypothetical protein
LNSVTVSSELFKVGSSVKLYRDKYTYLHIVYKMLCVTEQ